MKQSIFPAALFGLFLLADPVRDPKEWAFLILAGREKFLLAEETLDRSVEEEPGRLLLAETGLILIYDPENRDLRVGGSGADGTTVISGYWFALSAFHPDALKIEEAALRRMDGEDSPPVPVREK